MSCITGHAHRVTGVTSSDAIRVSGITGAALCRTTSPLQASAVAAGGILWAGAERQTGVLAAQCSLVCFVNTTRFLRVLPAESLWVDVGIDADYIVYSNTEWHVL